MNSEEAKSWKRARVKTGHTIPIGRSGSAGRGFNRSRFVWVIELFQNDKWVCYVADATWFKKDAQNFMRTYRLADKITRFRVRKYAA
jgi:hypothetical protein